MQAREELNNDIILVLETLGDLSQTTLDLFNLMSVEDGRAYLNQLMVMNDMHWEKLHTTVDITEAA